MLRQEAYANLQRQILVVRHTDDFIEWLHSSDAAAAVAEVRLVGSGPVVHQLNELQVLARKLYGDDQLEHHERVSASDGLSANDDPELVALHNKMVKCARGPLMAAMRKDIEMVRPSYGERYTPQIASRRDQTARDVSVTPGPEDGATGD